MAGKYPLSRAMFHLDNAISISVRTNIEKEELDAISGGPVVVAECDTKISSRANNTASPTLPLLAAFMLFIRPMFSSPKAANRCSVSASPQSNSSRLHSFCCTDSSSLVNLLRNCFLMLSNGQESTSIPSATASPKPARDIKPTPVHDQMRPSPPVYRPKNRSLQGFGPYDRVTSSVPVIDGKSRRNASSRTAHISGQWVELPHGSRIANSAAGGRGLRLNQATST